MMNFELVLSVTEKNTEALARIEKAQKAAEAAAKAASASATADAAKQATATAKQASELDKLEKSHRKVNEASKSMGDGARQAADALAKAESSAREMEAAIRAEASAAKQAKDAISSVAVETGRAAQSAERSSSAWRRAGEAIKSSVGKVLSGINFRRDGEVAAGGFMAGFRARISAAMPAMVSNSFQSAWSHVTGQYFATGQGSFRQNSNALMMASVNSFVGAAQNAQTMGNRLRADMGDDKVKETIARANAFMLQSPFNRDDVREASIAGAGVGLSPDSPTMRALGDAAAASGRTLTETVNAYKQALEGNLSALAEFGLGAKTGEDGKTTLDYKARGKDNSVAVDTGNKADIDAKIRAALDARFSGGMDRQMLTFPGILQQIENQWRGFMDKLMDSGPWEFIETRVKAILEYFKSGQGVDSAATNLGQKIKSAFEETEKYVLKLAAGFSTVKAALDPVAEAMGGWNNVLVGLTGLAAGSWFAGLVAPIIAVAAALWPAVAATWAFTAALLANPITWVVAGVVALGVAAWQLYTNWDQVTAALGRAWDSMKTKAGEAFEGLKASVSEKWEAIKTAVSDKVTAVVEAASAKWDDMKAKVGAAIDSVKATVSERWEAVKTAVADRVNAAVDAATTAWEKVKGAFSWDALAKIKEVFGPIEKWVLDWGGTISDAFGSAFKTIKGVVDAGFQALGKGFDAISDAYTNAKAWVTGDPAAKEAAKQNELIAKAGKAKDALAALDALKAKMDEVEAAFRTVDLTSGIQAAVGGVQGYLSGVSFYSHGAAMMQTLADGMKARASAAVEAVRNVTQQMRDYLPHSPAKVGPLSDLDQIRFSETLAGAITPGPAASAVAGVAAAMRAGIPQGGDFRVGVLASEGRARPGGSDAAQGSSGGGAVNVNVSMPVNIPAGVQDAGAILKAIQAHAYEVAAILKNEIGQQQRLNYREA